MWMQHRPIKNSPLRYHQTGVPMGHISLTYYSKDNCKLLSWYSEMFEEMPGLL